MSVNTKSNRPVVSILMLIGFATIVITGLLMYGLRYNSLLSAVHTVFGLLFISYGVFHLKNNLRSVSQYLKQSRIKMWACLSLLLIPVIVIALLLGLPPFQTVIDASYALKELKPIDRRITETLYTRFDQNGRRLSIDIKAGPHYSGPGAKVMGVTLTGIPQMAIWTEDSDGNYLETLYVTKKASNSSYIQGIFAAETVRRPEALPHWSHARGIESADGIMMPDAENPIVDAMTGATPKSSFELHTITETSLDKITVKLEINRSFDYNETFHSDAFPDDEVYSGSGHSAQPSLIYAATVDLAERNTVAIMQLLGRGHHSGKDGAIYTDLNGISTAGEMLSRIIVEALPE